eukprot:gb/GECH01010384.1/.p1 GENE.gb/GECH01010384.1/~~gb/GECH01010384.1/.p1  ORF type:complete len:154 (+),score=34.00 gb/GECH01010384.1/:1-462(+)
MVELRWISIDDPYFKGVLSLRYKMLRKPLGMEEGTENHKYDDLPGTYHLAAISPDNCVIGCVSVRIFSNEEKEAHYKCKLFQMAVDTDQQEKRVGTALIEELCRYMREEHQQGHIMCHAREVAVGFYDRVGFKRERGPFQEVGIPHYACRRDL